MVAGGLDAPWWPGAGADTSPAAREKESCARARGSGVIVWCDGSREEGADIYRGIFVISHTPWLACPVLDVQIMWDGGSSTLPIRHV